jgi:mannose-6-phosphate isomerase-like protein (cupin superfamily)
MDGLEPLVVYEDEAAFADNGEHGAMRLYLDFPSQPGRLKFAFLKFASREVEYDYSGSECEHQLLFGLGGTGRLHADGYIYRIKKERVVYIPPFSQATISEPDNLELLSISCLVTAGTDKHRPLVLNRDAASINRLPNTSGKRVNYHINSLTCEDVNLEVHIQTSRFPREGWAVTAESHQVFYVMQGRGHISTSKGSVTEWPIQSGGVFFLPQNVPFYIQGTLKAVVVSYHAASLEDHAYLPAAVEVSR